jgi:DNA-binding helix-hairpin-helix protein with protein kinase domain
MQVQCLSNGQRLTLDTAAILGAGGEALVYTILQDSSLVAKVYRTPDKVQARKLAVMVTNPPEDPMGSHGHISIVWPVSLLSTVDEQQVIGFLMPRVTGMHPLIACYNPAIRRQQWPLFNYRYLIRTAHNLAAAVRALHARGYVIGDVNESNILVTDTALVTLVDTDSFQVREPHNGVVYRCSVGKPEFTPPELQGCPFAQVDRAPEHDLFGLAVLIFQLLM